MKLSPVAFVAKPALLDALKVVAAEVHCAEERELFAQGDEPKGVYIIRGGDIRLTLVSPTGKEVATATAEPNSLLGLPAVVGRTPYSLSALAGAGSKVGFVSSDLFLDLMQSNAIVSMHVLEVLAAEVRAARQGMLEQ